MSITAPVGEPRSEGSIEFIFEELRHQEERARSEEEMRDTRLATLVALSGAVLGLLAASLPGPGLSALGTVFFCAAVVFFAAALLTATQAAIRLPLISGLFGGALEDVVEVGELEFANYLTEVFQRSEPDVLRRRVLGVMRTAIGARRRNTGRKERCLRATIWCVGSGVVAGAVYVGILVL
jgi:hypothetical protein